MSKEVEEIREKIKKLNLGQANELVEGVKEDFNIQETAVVQPVVAAPESEKAEKKDSNVSVQWVGMEKEGASIIPILGDIVIAIKELNNEEITKLKAKNRAEEGDKIILADIPRDKAEEFQKKMKEKQAKVEIVEIK